METDGDLRRSSQSFELDRELVSEREQRSAHVFIRRRAVNLSHDRLENVYDVGFQLNGNYNEDERQCARITAAGVESVRALGMELYQSRDGGEIRCQVSGVAPQGSRAYKYRQGPSSWRGDVRKQAAVVNTLLRFRDDSRDGAMMLARAWVAAAKEAGYSPVTFSEEGFNDALPQGDVSVSQQRARDRDSATRALEALVPLAARRWAESLSAVELDTILQRVTDGNILRALATNERAARAMLVTIARESGELHPEIEKLASRISLVDEMALEIQRAKERAGGSMDPEALSRRRDVLAQRKIVSSRDSTSEQKTSAARELIAIFEPRASIDVEVTSPTEHLSSWKNHWKIAVSIFARNNGPEDDYAIWTLKQRIEELAESNEHLRLFGSGYGNSLSGGSVRQYGMPPYGSRSRNRESSESLRGQEKGTHIRPEIIAQQGQLADALAGADAIVSLAKEHLGAYGYKVSQTWQRGARNWQELLSIYREVFQKEPGDPSRMVDDAAETLDPTTLSMLRAELESESRMYAANFASRMLRVSRPEMFESVRRGEFLPELMTELRRELMAELRRDSAKKITAALGERVGADSLTVSERLALNAGISHAMQMARVAMDLELSEQREREQKSRKAAVELRSPASTYPGFAFAGGARGSVYYQREQYLLARVVDPAQDSWFGWRLALVDATEEPPIVEHYPDRFSFVDLGRAAESVAALKVVDMPDVGTRLVGMLESPGNDAPSSVGELAWAVGTAPASLVGEVEVVAVDDSGPHRILTLRAPSTGAEYRVAQDSVHPAGRSLLAWTEASRKAIDKRESPSEASLSDRLSLPAPQAPQGAKPIQTAAAQPAAAAPPPGPDGVPAALIALGFVLPSRRKTEKSKAAELAIEARPGSTPGSTVMVVHGRATYPAKDLLRKLGLQYNKQRDGIMHGWWVTLGGLPRHVMPYDYVRASIALGRDYKLEWPASGPLEDESILRWETEPESAQREADLRAEQVQIEFAVDFATTPEGRGVWHTVDAPREAWSQLKPLGWEFQAPPKECRRSGCPACAAKLGQTYYTTDTEAARGMVGAMTDRARAALEAAEKELEASRATEGTIDCALPPNVKLYGYQNAGVTYALARSRVLIADEMGLGKTPQSIVTLNCDQQIKKVLVIVPAPLRRNWTREIAVFSARKHRVVRLKDAVSVRKGETKETAAARLRALNVDSMRATSADDMVWVVVGYEEAMTTAGEALDSIEFDAVVLDEAQAVKNEDAKRTARARELWERAAKRRIMLTGTPIENNLAELYNLLSMLDPTAYPPGGKFPSRIKYQAKARKDLEVAMRKSFMVRRLKADVLLDLPEKRWSFVELDGPDLDDARAEWNRFKEETGLSDDPAQDEQTPKARARAELESQLEIARALKDRKKVRELSSQIADLSPGGVDFADISRVRSLTGRAKVDLALEHINSKLESMRPEERSLVVWAHHDEVAEALAKGIRDAGYTAEVANGRRDSETRAKIVSDFQSGMLNVAVCTIGAMGTGHTMTRANEAMFVEFPWTPAKLVQAEDRIHRIGQKRGVMISYLYADGTLDVRMLAILRDKEMLSESTLDNEPGSEAVDQSERILAYVNSKSSGVAARASDEEIAAITRDWTKKVAEAGRTAVRRTEAIYAYSPEEKAIMAVAMNQLREACDRANQKDFCGFAAPDVRIGWAMADIPASQWTDELATLGHKLTIKYRGQLGGEVIERKPRPLSTEARLDE